MQEQMRIAKKLEPRMHRLVEDTMQYDLISIHIMFI
jgi:hypothetical protein